MPELKTFSLVRSQPQVTVTESSVPAPSETELKDFLNNIKKSNSKPALLSLIPAHSDAYIPKSLNPELPDILLNLFDSSLADADHPTLLK